MNELVADAWPLGVWLGGASDSASGPPAFPDPGCPPAATEKDSGPLLRKRALAPNQLTTRAMKLPCLGSAASMSLLNRLRGW